MKRIDVRRDAAPERGMPHRRSRAVLMLLSLIACADGPAGPEQVGPPAQVEGQGSNQSGAAGAALPEPLIALVTDEEGRAVGGADVVWSTVDGSITPSTGSTNEAGQAQATWTLAPSLGSQSAVASVGELSVTFVAIATMPATTTLLRVTGNAQTDTVGGTLDTLVVEVRLASGQGLAGLPISWSPAMGAGSVSAISPSTDAQGRARAVWTLGTAPGELEVAVSAEGLTPVTFTASAMPGAPAGVTIDQSSMQLDKWSDTTRAVAVVHDRHGNVLQTPVTWTSTDTVIARVSGDGLITSGSAGAASVIAVAGTASDTSDVTVAFQRNTACVVPASATPRGPASGPTSWAPEVIPGSAIAVADTTLIGPIGAPVAMDLDGDGDLDVFAPWYQVDLPATSRTIVGAVAHRQGGGRLVEATQDLWGERQPTWTYPRVALVFDANGDATRDLLLLDTGYDPAGYTGGCGDQATCPGAPNTLLLVTGSGIIGASQNLTFNSTSAFSHAGDAADINCDGNVDFFEGTWSASWAPEPAHLHVNAGGGTFGIDDGLLPPELPRNEGYVGAVFCDFDRDGDPELITSLYGHRLRVMGNDGFGQFRLLPLGTVPEAGGGDAQTEYADIRCADFDGDGWNDLALARHARTVAGEAVTLLLNTRNGSFRDASGNAPTTVAEQNVNGWFWQMEVSDLNQDGWPDLVLISPNVQARVLYNAGGGSFSEYIFPTDGMFWLIGIGNKIAVADFTGDGRPDLYSFRGRYDHGLFVNQ